jgi:hypothetical protein
MGRYLPRALGELEEQNDTPAKNRTGAQFFESVNGFQDRLRLAEFNG